MRDACIAAGRSVGASIGNARRPESLTLSMMGRRCSGSDANFANLGKGNEYRVVSNSWVGGSYKLGRDSRCRPVKIDKIDGFSETSDELRSEK